MKEMQVLKKKYSTLYSKVEKILFNYDVMDINYGDNYDEYSPEVSTILPRLKKETTVNDIVTIIREEFLHWFEEDVFTNKKHHRTLIKIAKEVKTEWKIFYKNNN